MLQTFKDTNVRYMPAVGCIVLLYFSRCSTVRVNMFSLFFVFVFLSTYYLCGKYYKPITVQYYIADCVGWVPRLCWTCEQTGLTNMLLKQNLFICRGLTVLEMWFV